MSREILVRRWWDDTAEPREVTQPEWYGPVAIIEVRVPSVYSNIAIGAQLLVATEDPYRPLADPTPEQIIEYLERGESKIALDTPFEPIARTACYASDPEDNIGLVPKEVGWDGSVMPVFIAGGSLTDAIKNHYLLMSKHSTSGGQLFFPEIGVTITDDTAPPSGYPVEDGSIQSISPAPGINCADMLAQDPPVKPDTFDLDRHGEPKYLAFIAIVNVGKIVHEFSSRRFDVRLFGVNCDLPATFQVIKRVGTCYQPTGTQTYWTFWNALEPATEHNQVPIPGYPILPGSYAIPNPLGGGSYGAWTVGPIDDYEKLEYPVYGYYYQRGPLYCDVGVKVRHFMPPTDWSEALYTLQDEDTPGQFVVPGVDKEYTYEFTTTLDGKEYPALKVVPDPQFNVKVWDTSALPEHVFADGGGREIVNYSALTTEELKDDPLAVYHTDIGTLHFFYPISVEKLEQRSIPYFSGNPTAKNIKKSLETKREAREKVHIKSIQLAWSK